MTTHPISSLSQIEQREFSNNALDSTAKQRSNHFLTLLEGILRQSATDANGSFWRASIESLYRKHSRATNTSFDAGQGSWSMAGPDSPDCYSVSKLKKKQQKTAIVESSFTWFQRIISAVSKYLQRAAKMPLWHFMTPISLVASSA